MIQAHPGLNLAIEGHTDATGSADFNMKLSQQRADSVREFLMKQGMSPDTITAKGMGQDNPVADNSTAAGRKVRTASRPRLMCFHQAHRNTNDSPYDFRVLRI